MRKQHRIAAPRPFHVSRCSIRDRGELVEVLRLVDAALQIRNDDDGDAAMRIVYDVLRSAEPSMSLVRDEFHKAASWGAAYHRLQRGESPLIAASSFVAEAGFIDRLLWNAVAWTGIEVGCRLEPRLAALGDYCVNVGYYVASEGPRGIAMLEAELARWVLETEQVQPDRTFRAYVDSQLLAEFWLDVDRVLHSRRATPLRPARSIEKVYDDLMFDIAWDDINEALGRRRPRNTTHLDNLAPVTWEPALPVAPPAQSDDAPPPGPTIDLRVVVAPPTIYDIPPQPLDIPAGWYNDPSRRFAFRWWDGLRWTEIVARDGVPTQDPLYSSVE